LKEPAKKGMFGKRSMKTSKQGRLNIIGEQRKTGGRRGGVQGNEQNKKRGVVGEESEGRGGLGRGEGNKGFTIRQRGKSWRGVKKVGEVRKKKKKRRKKESGWGGSKTRVQNCGGGKKRFEGKGQGLRVQPGEKEKKKRRGVNKETHHIKPFEPTKGYTFQDKGKKEKKGGGTGKKLKVKKEKKKKEKKGAQAKNKMRSKLGQRPRKSPKVGHKEEEGSRKKWAHKRKRG